MRKIAILSLALLAVGCTDAESAKRAAEQFGFTKVKITGYRWTGCDKGDDQRTGFTAVDVRGNKVEGVVCSQWGLFGKSSTVRLD